MFKDKVLLISGGTGSFGNAVLKKLLPTDIGEIRIFSRDELKQEKMRKFYNNDKIKFHIGGTSSGGRLLVPFYDLCNYSLKTTDHSCWPYLPLFFAFLYWSATVEAKLHEIWRRISSQELNKIWRHQCNSSKLKDAMGLSTYCVSCRRERR